MFAGGSLDWEGSRPDSKTRPSVARALRSRNALIGSVYRFKVGCIMLLHERPHDIHGYGGRLHIEPREFYVPFAGLVELAHPQDEFQDFLGVPCPEIHP